MKTYGTNPPMTAVDFVAYLRQTLIPDLIASGREYSAADFETACEIIEDLQGNDTDA